MLPEWSAVRAVLLAWPYAEGDWSESYQRISACYAGILRTLCEHIETWVLVHPSCKQDFDRYSANVNQNNLKVFEQAYNDTWIRDYGPLSLPGKLCNFQFDGWGKKYDSDLDNAAVNKIFENTASGVMPLLSCSQLVVEGGALEINDDGILLANKDCLFDRNRNPSHDETAVREELQEQLNIKDFALVENVCLSGDDTDGHIDTLARFASNDQVLYCGSDGEHPDHLALQSLETQLQDLAKKYSWELTALPTPVIYEGDKLLAASYANFLICNDCVFVPAYDVIEDERVEKIFKRVFPKSKILMLPCLPLLSQNGSLHCATMQVATAAWGA